MQITIDQPEIETAIRNHILSQITVNSNMVIDIDLRATRGPGGYSAVIDIRPDGSPKGGQPIDVAEEQTADAKAAAETTSTEAPKAEVKAEPKAAANDAATTDKADAQPAAVQAPEADAPKPVLNFGRKTDAAPAAEPAAEGTTKSIFAGMKKPVNSAATA